MPQHFYQGNTMERWVIYAFISMAFAGFTSVIAKMGLAGISGDLGLAVRTCFVFVFVLIFAGVVVPASEMQSLGWKNILWLAASGVTTAGSWIFYYKAIKLGNVSTVALIDKGSVVIALLLSYLILQEAMTPAKLMGGALIVAGLLVIARG
jgi:transporter family protein